MKKKRKIPYIIYKKLKKRKSKFKRPICCLKNSRILNYNLNEKNKARFITQLFRWLNKDPRHYKLNYFLKKKYIISNNDILYLSVKIQKAGWKKLLLKLNYHLKDYKELKRRSYSLTFIFFFNNVNDSKNLQLTIDIESCKLDKFNIFVTTNAYFFKDFYNMINILNKREINDDNIFY